MDMERAIWKPNSVEISPTCPRCGSMNTKFCYYNNYSLTQPRYFCKGCRRYWTKGGSLRNVPVGGGCRKTRRGRSIRVLTDHPGPSGRGLAQGTSLGHNTASRSDSNPAGPTSPADGPGGPNINLAVVYANFMNQKPDPEDQPRPNPREVMGNDDGSALASAGPPFEFLGYPMLNLDYFAPMNGIGPQDGGLIVDEYVNNHQQTLFFHEQFGNSNNNNNCLLPSPIVPGVVDQELNSEGVEWSNHMDVNMMFPLIESQVIQGCPEDHHHHHHHHANASANSLFNIPNYDSIFRP